MSEFIFFKVVSLFFSFGFVFLAWFSKKIVGYWLNPSSIFSLFWALYTLLPLTIVHGVPINPFAIVYILLFNVCFISSVYLFNWKVAFIRNDEKPAAVTVFDTNIFHFCFYFVTSISVISLLVSVLEQGLNLAEFFVNPMAFAGKFAGMRYGGELTPSVFSQLGLTTSYIVIVLGGILYGVCKKKKLLILVLSFLPSILVMALQSAKGLFFFSIFMFFAGILLVKLYDKSYTLINKEALKKMLIYGSLVLPVLLMSFLSRGLHESNDSAFVINKLARYLFSYSSGHLYAFSDWFSERYFSYSEFKYKQEEFSLGFYSFMSAFKLLGDGRYVPVGTYSEYFIYGDYIKTNIYSVFRGIITDFTLIGSLVFSCFIGFCCNLFFYRLLCTRINSFYSMFFIFFIGISYQTYLISSLMWITIPVVFLVLILFLFLYYNIYRGIRF